MATITISSYGLKNWQGPASCNLRIWPNGMFVALDGTLLEPWDMQSPNGFYQTIPCTASGNVLTIPQFTLLSTADAKVNPQATYRAAFYTNAGALISFFNGFQAFQLNPTPTTTTWDRIAQDNNPPIAPPQNIADYVRGQVGVATTSQIGMAQLSVPAATIGTAIVVGDNDPRLAHTFDPTANISFTGNVNYSIGPVAPSIGLTNNSAPPFIVMNGTGSQRTILEPGSAVGGTVVLRLPNTPGSAGQAVVSDGAGVLSFAGPFVADPGANGLVARTGLNLTAPRTLTPGSAAIAIANGNGVAGNPTVDLANTAVTPGPYTSANITVDAQGRITAAANGSGGSAADASATVKGIAKLSVAPASVPIAVGDNDPRLNIATESTAGLLSASDKTKLDNIIASNNVIISTDDPAIGLVGDARYVIDAGITLGVASSTLTSATANFQAGDVGKLVNLVGAGPQTAISNAPIITVASASPTLTGTASGANETYFLDQLAPGLQIVVNGTPLVVLSVESNTSATLTTNAGINYTGNSFTTATVWKGVISSRTDSSHATIIPGAPVAATGIGACIYTDNTLAWTKLNAYAIAHPNTIFNFVPGVTGVFRQNYDGFGLFNIVRAELRMNGCTLVGGFGYGTQNVGSAVLRPATGFTVNTTSGSRIFGTSQPAGTGFAAGAHMQPGDVLTIGGSDYLVQCVSSDNQLVVGTPAASTLSSTSYVQTPSGYIGSGANGEGIYTATGTPGGTLQSTFNYIHTVEAGSNVVQLINPTRSYNGQTQIARYKAGDPVFVGGFDHQNSGFPPNFKFFEYNWVESVNAATGQIFLKYPTKYHYDELWNFMPTDTNSTEPMAALIIPLNRPVFSTTNGRVQNYALTIRDMICSRQEVSTIVPGSARSNINIEGCLALTLVNCSCDKLAVGDNQIATFIDCNIGAWVEGTLGNFVGGFEVDKGLEKVIIKGGHFQSVGQGTGAHLISISGSTVDSINVTPRSLEVEKCDLLGSVGVSSGWAISSIKLVNNRFWTDSGLRTVNGVVFNSTINVTAPIGTFRITDVGSTIIGASVTSTSTTIIAVASDGSGCTLNNAAIASATNQVDIVGGNRILVGTGLFNVTVLGTPAPVPTNTSINVIMGLQPPGAIGPPRYSHNTIGPGTVLSKVPHTGTGTITSISGTAVVGSGTLFTSQLAVKSLFYYNGQSSSVAAIADDTHLTLTAALPIVPSVAGQPYQYDTQAGAQNRGTIVGLQKAISSSTTSHVTAVTYTAPYTTITLDVVDPNLVQGQELQWTDGTNTFSTAIVDANPAGLTSIRCLPPVYLAGSPQTIGSVFYTLKWATTQLNAQFKATPVAGDVFSYNSCQKIITAGNTRMIDGVEHPLNVLGAQNALPPTAEYFDNGEDAKGYFGEYLITDLPKDQNPNRAVFLDIKGYVKEVVVKVTTPYSGSAGPFLVTITDQNPAFQDPNYRFAAINTGLAGPREILGTTSSGAQSGDVLTPQKYRYVDTLSITASGDSGPTPAQEFQGFVYVKYIKRIVQ